MDALLLFDVLLYLNGYYYLLAAICHPVMVIAKFFSPNYETPEYINIDVAVVVTLITADLLKILLYKKLREQRRAIAVVGAVFMTGITFCCTLYLLFMQQGTTKMEYIISTITMLLYLSELIFGILSFFPCFVRLQLKRMDAELFFEVLLYLNCYYFGLFFVTETIMVLAKYFSDKFPTPNINIDGGVLCIIILVEFIKLFTFRKTRETRPGLSNFLAIFLTFVSITCLLYVLIIQQPVLKMEYLVCGVMFVLMTTIMVYGFLQFLPCCQKKIYV